MVDLESWEGNSDYFRLWIVFSRCTASCFKCIKFFLPKVLKKANFILTLQVSYRMFWIHTSAYSWLTILQMVACSNTQYIFCYAYVIINQAKNEYYVS